MYLRRLKDLREDNELKQDNVAYYLKITRQQYQLYESGKRKLPIDKLIEICKLYNVTADYILGLTQDPTPNWKNKKVLPPMKTNTIENILNNNNGNIGDININQS